MIQQVWGPTGPDRSEIFNILLALVRFESVLIKNSAVLDFGSKMFVHFSFFFNPGPVWSWTNRYSSVDPWLQEAIEKIRFIKILRTGPGPNILRNLGPENSRNQCENKSFWSNVRNDWIWHWISRLDRISCFQIDIFLSVAYKPKSWHRYHFYDLWFYVFGTWIYQSAGF